MSREELFAAAADAQQELERAAQVHKRSAAAHRRSAQGVRKAMDRFAAACESLGIKVVTEHDTDPGGQSQNDREQQGSTGT